LEHHNCDSLEYKKNNSKTVLSALQNQISVAKDSLKLYQSAVDEKIQNISDMLSHPTNQQSNVITTKN